ncbi:MAG: hypothetical protein K5650_06595 [Bacteroidales bacterium]|nr:hypothetical protein [Bacteroidales bacterium]
MELIEQVKVDIQQFLNHENDELLFNERDFQMHLALHLIKLRHYHDVDLEYYVPCGELKNYKWNSEMKLDILVHKDNEYLPVELKYKTRRYSKQMTRFDEHLTKPIDVLKNQGAQDLGMYDFWKDVHRIELVRNRFGAVSNGLAVFATNDPYYVREDYKVTSNHYNFRMTSDNTSRCRHWMYPKEQRKANYYDTYPDFDLEGSYAIHWSNTQFEGVPIYYCIVEI